MQMIIEHINLRAPLNDILIVKDFYINTFKLKEGFRPTFSVDGFWLYENEHPLIHLTIDEKPLTQNKPYHLNHVAFRRNDLEKFCKHLNEQSIEFYTYDLDEIGATMVSFKDPLGTGLEVNFYKEK